MPDHKLVTTGRYSISRKAAALFILLILLAGVNQLVIHRAQQSLAGAEEDINATGRLRYLSQQIQSAFLAAALTQSWNGETEALIAEFDAQLAALENHVAKFDLQSGERAAKRLPDLAAVYSAWAAYRLDVQSVLDARPGPDAAAAMLPRLAQGARKVLERADQATSSLAEQAGQIKREIATLLDWLAAFDLAILLAAFFAVQRLFVRPLRRLADASLRFADGEYSARTGYRADDEIGQVSEAFDHMAEQTQEHIQVIAADLKEIRQQQETLEKLSKAVENSPASVVITDPKGIIEYVNDTFTRVTGYAYEEAVGQTPRMLQSGRTSPDTYRELWQTILSGGVWHGELMNRRKNGELFWENTYISSTRNERGEISHFISVKEDITLRKRAEQDLLYLNINLEKRIGERTRQLENAYMEQEAFSYSVSHDLRAPLRSIHGFAHAMAEDCAGCSRTESLGHLQRVQDASIRMGQIIDDLLSLGEVSKADLNASEVNMSEMAREVLEGLARHEPGRKVEFEIAGDVVVRGDKRLLRIALENLLGNAWKYTAKQEAARIVFGADVEEGKQVIYVRDNGAGFNMAYADKLFKPFQRMHSPSEFKGSGIGLAIVHRIITRHEGDIWAHSEKNGGATFSFSLPARGDGIVSPCRTAATSPA